MFRFFVMQKRLDNLGCGIPIREADDFSYFKSMKNLKGLIHNIHRLTE
jgi:hypothetical protein